jgi:putative Holliday junction resolvase
VKVLGVDWGRARIGVAVSDETGLLARPLATVSAPSRAAAAAEVGRLAAREGAQEIVVGLPLNMDGTEGDSARSARAFSEVLASCGLPVTLWDERLSTVEGERRAREAGRGTDSDQAAACVVLESFLNARRGGGR